MLRARTRGNSKVQEVFRIHPQKPVCFLRAPASVSSEGHSSMFTALVRAAMENFNLTCGSQLNDPIDTSCIDVFPSRYSAICCFDVCDRAWL